MQFTRVGSSGLKVSNISYGSALTIGTESDDLNYAKDLISTAWQLGIRSFDTANFYGNGQAELLLGKVLKDYPRDEYILASKVCQPMGNSIYHKGLSRKHILWAFKESIKRLNLEYVDLYYAHRYDPEVPIYEIVNTFNSLIDSGYIRYWATSEWPLDALIKCSEYCEKYGYEKPIAEQFIYSYAVVKAEKNGIYDYCKKNAVGTFGYSPLCQGWLTGKYSNGIPDNSRMAKMESIRYNKTSNFYSQYKNRIDHFLSVCSLFGYNPAEVAIKWCLFKGVLPILGASKPQQLINSLEFLDRDLDSQLWNRLSEFPPDH